jgi:hypothetical protein
VISGEQLQPIDECDHILLLQFQVLGVQPCSARTMHVLDAIVDEEGACRVGLVLLEHMQKGRSIRLA